MPAGRPPTTGTARPVQFRPRPDLAARLEQRRAYPDLRNDPFYGGPVPKAGRPPAAGTVAARDLAVYYDLLHAELADAAAELDRDQVGMILDAVWSLATDATWVTNAPAQLADEIAEAYGDDEDGPEPERVELAATVRTWPRLRALAVLEACLAVRARGVAGPDLDEALAAVGLAPEGRGARR